MTAIPKFSFTPQTVQEAVEVLKNELRTNSDSRKKLKDIIENAFNEAPDDFWLSDLSELIVKSIIKE